MIHEGRAPITPRLSTNNTTVAQQGQRGMAQQMAEQNAQLMLAIQQSFHDQIWANNTMMIQLMQSVTEKQAGTECTQSLAPTQAQAHGVVVSKVKRQRAPTEEQALRKVAFGGSPEVAIRKGPVIGTATNVGVITAKDIQHGQILTNMSSVLVRTVTGEASSAQQGKLPVSSISIQGPIMPKAENSLAAVRKLNKQGYTYAHAPGAAGLMRGEETIECPPNGNFYRLPVALKPSPRAAEMRLAENELLKFRQQRIVQQMVGRFKSMHTPKCMPGSCPDDSCSLGGMHRKPIKPI